MAVMVGSGHIAINQVVYAEVAVGFRDRERFERTLGGVGLMRANIPWAAAWLVARAFKAYRDRGGARTALPDFFIGAHAAAAGIPLLTRDASRVRTYFPEVARVAPDMT